jgi:hypothetical protein
MENLAREGPEIRMAAIGAAYPRHSFCPVGASGKLFQAIDDKLRRIGVTLVSGKRETHDALDGSLPVRDIGSHTLGTCASAFLIA